MAIGAMVSVLARAFGQPLAAIRLHRHLLNGGLLQKLVSSGLLVRKLAVVPIVAVSMLYPIGTIAEVFSLFLAGDQVLVARLLLVLKLAIVAIVALSTPNEVGAVAAILSVLTHPGQVLVSGILNMAKLASRTIVASAVLNPKAALSLIRTSTTILFSCRFVDRRELELECRRAGNDSS